MTHDNDRLATEYGASGRKLLAHLPVLQEAQTDRILRPITVQLAPTEACDSDCSFCSVQNRPQKRYLPFAELTQLLADFRALGAKSVELTGGGNPLLYKDRAFGDNVNGIVRVASDLGLKVGIITNSESLAVLATHLHDKIDWVRVSLAKLEEGKAPDDYDLAGFPERKVGFSWVVHDQMPRGMPLWVDRVAERFPAAKFVRVVADCTKPGGQGKLQPFARAWPSWHADDRWFHKGSDGEPFPHSCTVGLTRPYVAAPPATAGDQEYRVYACTSHVLRARNYDLDYALCGVSQVREAWPRMWQRWRETGYPYEVKGNEGRGWDKTCGGFCYYGDSNRFLHDVVHPAADSAFA